MNAWPTNNPTTSKSSQNDRDAASSRSSLRTSQLSERKKHLLEPTGHDARAHAKLVERPFTDDSARAEQHEAIANPLGVDQRVNRQEHRASGGRGVANDTH